MAILAGKAVTKESSGCYLTGQLGLKALEIAEKKRQTYATQLKTAKESSDTEESETGKHLSL